MLNNIKNIITQYSLYLYIEISITNICNYSCYYCCFKNKLQFTQHINIPLLINFIEYCYNYINTNIVLELTGGEPTLHPQLLEFCESVKKINTNIKIFIFSNFSNKITLYNQLLALNTILFLTWHSLSFDRLNMLFIKNIKSLNLIPRILIMFENRYEKESLYTYNFLQNKYQQNVVLSELTYNKNTKKINMLNDYYSENNICMLNDIQQNNLFNIEKNNYITIIYCNNKTEIVLADNVKSRNFKKYICAAGKNYMYVDEFGYIYPCRNYKTIKKIIGHISLANKIFVKKTLCMFSNCCSIVKSDKSYIF